uniref:DegQ family serine endoprotease n=1 Tax=Thaumasiovibrio occultus TaxID=1891184 RepID=UPI000B34B75F|nr:DegQ family serine endoprotease [Thaumasiovibrio occultus]
MKRKPLLALSALALSLSTCLVAAPSAFATLPSTVNGQTLPSLAPMLERVTPAVVNIFVEGTQTTRQRRHPLFNEPNNNSRRGRTFLSLGSGVVIDADEGYVITNHHVIDGADSILIQLHDGREYEAELIGSDEMADIALLQVLEYSDLTEVAIANSDSLRVGDFAVAIGNPFGLGQTVTSGIISALGRSGLNLDNYENYIQTDAAINSGNSGGALVNLNGELIGINNAIYGPNGGNVGIGFAIPSNMAANLVSQMLEYGEVRRGMLGVQGRELTSELAESFGYDINQGAFVAQVIPGTPAEKAGLQAGDVIVAVNGIEVDSFSELRAKIATIGAEKTVKLGVLRDGESLTVAATLVEAGAREVVLDDIHPAFEGAELANSNNGVEVMSVAPDSPAQIVGMEEGDVIIGVHRLGIKNIDELREVLNRLSDRTIALKVKRGHSYLYLMIR